MAAASYSEKMTKSEEGLPIGAFALDNRRRAALSEVDDATFSLFHVKVYLVASAGFFTDAYDIFAISIASIMLGAVYGGDSDPNSAMMRSNICASTTLSADAVANSTTFTLSPNQDLGLKIAAPVGNFFGQLLFGLLADVLGRKRMYGAELTIIIVATFAQALASSGPNTAVGVVGVLIVWRVIAGVGIGGDYPLSAVIASEFSSTRFRGRLMTAVFAAQGWGQFTAALIGLIVVRGYKSKLLEETLCDPVAVDFMWRLLIGLGCIPGVIALYFRMTIPETPRFTMDIERNVQQAAADVENFLKHNTFTVDPDSVVQKVIAPRATRKDFITYFSKRKNMMILIGTAYSWFALDIAFYGINLNSSSILIDIGFYPVVSSLGPGNIYKTLLNACTFNLILSAAGLIPGYYATFALIDYWGRKPIQLMGFTMLTILYLCMGAGYEKMSSTEGGRNAFVFLFCLADFFLNFGPNTTTFIIPGEVFPTRYRSTCHGISAASGKIGAIIAQVVVTQLIKSPSPNSPHKVLAHLFVIFGCVMVTGIISTLILPETKDMTLEDLSNEKQEGFVQGVARNVEVRDGIVVSSSEHVPLVL